MAQANPIYQSVEIVIAAGKTVDAAKIHVKFGAISCNLSSEYYCNLPINGIGLDVIGFSKFWQNIKI